MELNKFAKAENALNSTVYKKKLAIFSEEEAVSDFEIRAKTIDWQFSTKEDLALDNSIPGEKNGKCIGCT